MDIKNLNQHVTSSRTPDAIKPSRTTGSPEKGISSPLPQTDKVTLTQTSAQVSSLEKTARSVNVDNSARISELKAAISDGSFQINAERIADKLMQTEALFSRY